MKDSEDEYCFESAEQLLARKMDYILQLKNAILRLHGCESEYAGTESVTETFQDEAIWEYQVEIFHVRGHPAATKCYAWSHLTGESDDGRRIVAVLELPPVDSPETAVKVTIESELK